MPDMPTPVALAFSDLHLSLNAPVCRKEQNNWLEVQHFYLDQVCSKASILDVPVLFAGDLFDRWNSPAELISLAMRCLPHNMYCVPGQHDLPNHRIDLMHRSAYGVLVEGGTIKDCSGGKTIRTSDADIYGFGWDEQITPPAFGNGSLKIALIHSYCWIAGKEHYGATHNSNVTHFGKVFKGYDIAIFGDNHKDFIVKEGDTIVVNCGRAVRRKADEIVSTPCMYVILSDGTVRREYFDTTIDRFFKNAKERESASTLDLQSFLKHLQGLAGNDGLDFRESVMSHLRDEDIETGIKEIIIKAIEYGQLNRPV